MQRINKIKFSIRCFIENCIYHLSAIIPKKNIVLCTAWYGQKYIDNTKYVYEYLLNDQTYQVVWMTNNKDIYRELKEQGKPVARFNSLKGVLLQIRCKAVFSTIQFSDFNTSLLSRCLYIDLGHGHPIKDPGGKSPMTRLQHRLIQKRLFYYAVVASDFSKSVTVQTVSMPLDHILISDYARNDVFVDEKLREGKNLEIENIKKGRKAIVYMPTHRSDGKVALDMNSILPLKEIQDVCEKLNWVFIIKKHFYHRHEKDDISRYSNIYDVTSVENLDPQVLLYQADVLVTDYSACYIDYLLLKRPMLFYQFDIQQFQDNERKLFFPFSKLNIAPISYAKEDFVKDMVSVISQKDDPYYNNRSKHAHVYFNNIDQKEGRKNVKLILDSLWEKHSM